MYDHNTPSRFSLRDCEAAIGKAAELPLTGEIIDAGVSPAGAFIKFKPDERWGFGERLFVLDLDAVIVSED